MPQPTPGDVHVNGPLSNVSIAFLQEQKNFIADQVFPVVPVQNQTDLYFEFTRNDFLRDEARPRADATETAGGGFGISTTTYSATVKGFHKDIGDQLRANANTQLALDSAATRFITTKALIGRERTWGSTYFASSVWGTDKTVTLTWDLANSTPRFDVDTGKAVILQNTGYEPNTLVLGYQVFIALRSNADVRDMFKYVSAESIDEAMLARYFGIDRVLVSRANYASNAEAATAAYSFINGKHALLCYVPSGPALFQPSAGYLFGWTGYLGSSNGIRIKKFRMEQLAADRVEIEYAYDFKVVSTALGYFFPSVVS